MSTPSATPADTHVFISYSSKDAADAERLKALLKREGFAAWRDRDNLFPGDNVNVDIPEALRNIPVVIVLWSANSIKSEWVCDEANYARFAGRLVPLSISGFAYQDLPEKFRPINCQSLDEVEADPSRLKQKLADMIAEAQDSALANIDVSRLPTTFADKLFGRDKETAELDAAWDERDTNILVYDAMGGTGKTALIKKFVERVTDDEKKRGAKAVFAWSFYSQGTDENRQASADQFFSEALRFFGHHGEMPSSPHDKGVRLAELIAVKRSLVILDGLEPLQYGPSRRGRGRNETNVGVTGGLKDKGLEAMLRQLATRNPGLVVVTTRLALPDLRDKSAPQVITQRLAHIPHDAGVALLRHRGLEGPEAELLALVKELRGHAIALNLVATYLVEMCEGDIRRKDTLPPLAELEGQDERDPFRVMAAYERMFQDEITRQVEGGRARTEIPAARQLALLFLMGLFDRPMEKAARDALLAAPVIEGLTEPLAGITPRTLDYAIQELRRFGLLLPKGETAAGEIDAHPLVREYFGLRLEENGGETADAGGIDAFKAAHSRLYDFYRFQFLDATAPAALRTSEGYALLAYQASYPDANLQGRIKQALAGELNEKNAPNVPPSLWHADADRLRPAAAQIDGPEWQAALAAFLPEDEAAMAPCFAAIAHGAAAGRHDEAFAEVYWPRVARGDEKFATKKLGLYGADLAAVAHFFQEPFATPHPNLSAARQALVLNLAGFRLRALGRLDEAVEPFEADTQMSVDQEDWHGAASGASNLSELLLTVGRVAEAVEAGAASVAHAETFAEAARSRRDIEKAKFWRMVGRTTEAEARLAAGTLDQAEALFVDAEAIQRARQPAMPRLYALQGYRYCDLLLARARSAEAAARGTYGLSLYASGSLGDLLGHALTTLTLGRAALVAAGTAPADGALLNAAELATAAGHLDAAVDGLRNAGTSNHMPRGLLARAACHRLAGRDELAAKDLQEAFEIATRGNMQLFLVDCGLEAAAQRLACATPSAAALDQAAKALDTAEAIIRETGYARRWPELHLGRAELAHARGDGAGRHAALAEAIAVIRDGWWVHLPRLAALVDAGGCDDLRPALASLTTAAADYQTQADATGGQPTMPSDKAPAAASPPVPEAPSASEPDDTASEPDDTASAARATRSLLSRIFGRR